MIIQIKVKTRAGKNSVYSLGKNVYNITISAPPFDNEANESIIKLLAEYFQIPPSGIKIKKGHKSKIKLIEIND
jgi:uncharacterized protein (TIGR00251 family)